MASPIISEKLSQIFNECLLKDIFPGSLKIAEVIPIFKKGDPKKAANYRPIFIHSQFSKFFGKLLFNRIYSYLEKYNLLSGDQFGFRKNSSTTLALD